MYIGSTRAVVGVTMAGTLGFGIHLSYRGLSGTGSAGQGALGMTLLAGLVAGSVGLLWLVRRRAVRAAVTPEGRAAAESRGLLGYLPRQADTPGIAMLVVAAALAFIPGIVDLHPAAPVLAVLGGVLLVVRVVGYVQWLKEISLAAQQRRDAEQRRTARQDGAARGPYVGGPPPPADG